MAHCPQGMLSEVGLTCSCCSLQKWHVLISD